MTRETNYYIEQIKDIVLKKLVGYDAQVYFFGSRAKNKAHSRSDVDLAILPKMPLPHFLIAEICDALEESNIPYQVDIVDLSHSDEKFRTKVLIEGIKWKD
jgi:predicted nucleotidyltransferase